MKKIACLLLGISSISWPVSAQADKTTSTSNDQWMIYDRVASDGRPLVVIAQTGNGEAKVLLAKGRASVVICSSVPSKVNSQGMPQGTDRLYSLEDQLDNAPALRAAGAIRIASVTGQGQRRMFFVHRDPLDLSPILQSNQVPGFSCDAMEVTDRPQLVNLVTPTVLESQLNGDQEVIANLQKSGDDGSVSRKTDFWFYGQEGSINSLAVNLKVYGFSIDHRLSNPTGVVLSREMAVNFESLAKITPLIVEAATQSGVDYDGWETVVISQASVQPNSRKER